MENNACVIGREGRSYVVRASTVVPGTRDEVFAFFSDAANLEALTPKHLNFSIVSPQPVNIKQGAIIDYRLKLYGIPFGWQTEITVWEPPFRFVDEQRKGPYHYWIHEHSFVEQDATTLVQDHVCYSPWGGALVNALFVARDVEKIFNFRARRLQELFTQQQLRSLA